MNDHEGKDLEEFDNPHDVYNKLCSLYPEIRFYNYSYNSNEPFYMIVWVVSNNYYLLPRKLGLWPLQVWYRPHQRGEWIEVRNIKGNDVCVML